MGHNISAMITKGTVDSGLAQKIDLPIIQLGTFTMVPLDAAHSDYWAEKLEIGHKSLSTMIHDCEATLEFARILEITKFALIQTDYFGGIGSQAATVYVGKTRIFLEEAGKVSRNKCGPINTALKEIGVKTERGKDEFSSLRLPAYRSFEDYFEAYNED